MDTNSLATIGAAGAVSGLALEQALEHFVMDRVPDKAKPYVPIALGVGGVTLGAIQAGMPWQQALAVGVTAAVTAMSKHDMAPAVSVAAASQAAPDASQAAK